MVAERLSFSIERTLQNLGLSQAVERQSALTHWNEVAGPELRQRAVALHVRDGVLQVLVCDSAWAQQLSMMKPTLLRDLNARLGQATLKDIRVRVGQVPAPVRRQSPVPLTERELQSARARVVERLGNPSESAQQDPSERAFRRMAAAAEARSARLS